MLHCSLQNVSSSSCFSGAISFSCTNLLLGFLINRSPCACALASPSMLTYCPWMFLKISSCGSYYIMDLYIFVHCSCAGSMTNSPSQLVLSRQPPTNRTSLSVRRVTLLSSTSSSPSCQQLLRQHPSMSLPPASTRSSMIDSH